MAMWLTFSASSAASSATRLLAQLATLYYFLLLASSGLSRDRLAAAPAHQLQLQQLADLILLADCLRATLRLLLDSGRRRPIADLADAWRSQALGWAARLLAVADVLLGMVLGWQPRLASGMKKLGAQLAAAPLLRLLPDGLLVAPLRLARLPHTLRSLVGVEDMNMAIGKAAVAQLAVLLLGMALPGQVYPGLRTALAEPPSWLQPALRPLRPLLQHLPVSCPWYLDVRLALLLYYGLMLANGLLRSGATQAERVAQARLSAVAEEPASAEELDQICKDMIRRAKLLQGVMAQQPDEFLEDIMSMLKHETYMPGSNLATIGEVGHHMFFLAKGTVTGHTANNKQFKLGAGTALGEIALMRPMSKRTATLTAATRCEVFLLNQEAFDRLRSSYPALAQDVRQMVSGYLRNDSALYVTICMRMAVKACYVIAGLFFGTVYVVAFLLRN